MYQALKQLFLDASGSRIYQLFYDTNMAQMQMIWNTEMNGYEDTKSHDICFLLLLLNKSKTSYFIVIYL